MGNRTTMRGMPISFAASPNRKMGQMAHRSVWISDITNPRLLSQYLSRARLKRLSLLVVLQRSLLILLTMTLAPTSLAAEDESIAGAAEQQQLETFKETVEWTEQQEQIIEDIERTSGPFAVTLFEPLMALAKHQISAGETVNATDTLQRAQNIAHRNKGVHTLAQVEIVQILKDLALAENDFNTANLQERFTFFVKTQNLDQGDPAIINLYSEFAEWNTQTGQSHKALSLLEEALEIARELNIDPLPLEVQLNRARRLAGLCCRAKALKKVVSQIELEDDQNENLTSAYIELGQTMTQGQRKEQAAEYYAKAFQNRSDILEPQPIASRAFLNNRKTTFSQREYRTASVIPGMRTYPWEEAELIELAQMTDKEIYEDPARPPGWFIHDPQQKHHRYIDRPVRPIRTAVGFSQQSLFDGELARSMIGEPILYNVSQMKRLLSTRRYNNLHQYKIELTFTVDADGDLSDIRVSESTAPKRLNRLLKKTLEKIYYQPAIENGIPIARQDVRLTQTFKTKEMGAAQ